MEKLIINFILFTLLRLPIWSGCQARAGPPLSGIRPNPVTIRNRAIVGCLWPVAFQGPFYESILL